MRIFSIDELIAAHWGSCTVSSGETPEDYAMRQQEESRMRIRVYRYPKGRYMVRITHCNGRTEILEGDL